MPRDHAAEPTATITTGTIAAGTIATGPNPARGTGAGTRGPTRARPGGTLRIEIGGPVVADWIRMLFAQRHAVPQGAAIDADAGA